MAYITGCIDTEKILIDNLTLVDVIKLCVLNKIIYKNYSAIGLIADLRLCIALSYSNSWSELISNASILGRTHLLSRLFSDVDSFIDCNGSFQLAIKHGHIDTVKLWLQQPGCRTHDQTIYETENLAILDLLLLNKEKLRMDHHDAMTKAAKCGRLDIMKWWNIRHALSSKCFKSTWHWTLAASAHGHVDILIWLKATFSDFHSDNNILKAAYEGKYIYVLEWWIVNATEPKHPRNCQEFNSDTSIIFTID